MPQHSAFGSGMVLVPGDYTAIDVKTEDSDACVSTPLNQRAYCMTAKFLTNQP